MTELSQNAAEDNPEKFIMEADNLTVEQQGNQSDWLKRAKYLGLNAIAFATISPLNEAIRLAAFGGAETISRSPLLGALSYGISTLGVEATGVLAIAPILETDTSERALSFINKRLTKLGVKEETELSKYAKFNILLFAGAPVRVLAEHREDLSRNKDQNIRLGLVSSVELAGLCAIQGALMSEGINVGLEHPAEVGGAAGGLMLAAGIGRKAWDAIKLNNYYGKMKFEGPQQEGIDPENFKKSLHDKQSVKARVLSNTKLPVFVPMHYASWLNPEFFAKKGYEPSDLAYSSVPQSSFMDKDPSFIRDLFHKAAIKGYKGIIFDYFENNEIFETVLPSQSIDELYTSDGTPSQVFHYHVKTHSIPGGVEKYKTDKNIISINKDSLDEYFPNIWSIYDSRFQDLVDDHPIRGQLSMDELKEVLGAEGCSLKAYVDDNGDVQSFGYLIEDLGLCPWLNQAYFEQQSDGNPTVYFSGIASAKSSSRLTSFSLINAFTFDMAKLGPDANLTFECSNKSARYIPRIVKKSFQYGGMRELEEMTETHYHYKVAKLTK